MTEPAAGTQAPDFQGTLTDGRQIGLADLKGRYTVLYFYPRDNTPGCTTEARDFQALLPEFERRNAVVIGVSNDDAKSHTRFCEKQGLTFDLIADTDRAVSEAFDVIREKKMYGKTFEGIERSTFLIDPQGTVVRAWRKVKVNGHVEEVLNELPPA